MRTRRHSISCIALLLAFPLLSPSKGCAQNSPLLFEKEILPLLEQRCVKCHAGSEPAAKLDVRTRAGLVKGGLSGPALVLGSADKSLFYQRIKAGQMPPGGPPLPAAGIEKIRTWIERGAPGGEPLTNARDGNARDGSARDGKHWAFQPPKRPPVPRVPAGVKIRTPIDAFLAAELARKNLSFSPEADRVTVLRRAYIDLIGLPPTPQDVDRFLADDSPNSFDKEIDRLLASSRYGERWARHWLDVAGYADSEGGEAADVLRPNAWRYRDYVIRAFNSDKPYDVFVREQMAGDELSEYWKYEKLPAQKIEQVEATGYLRMAADGSQHSFTRQLNVDYLWQALFDTQQIVASSLLGLTMQCARCHDHKYEPVSHQDYYKMQAVFAGGWRPDGPVLAAERRAIVLATPAEREFAGKVNGVQEPVVKALKELLKARSDQYRAKHPKGREASAGELRKMFPEYSQLADSLERQIKEEEARKIELPQIRAFYDVDANPPPVHVLRRGDHASPRGEEVKAGVPAVLDDPSHPFQLPEPGSGAKSSGRRLAFAEWLMRPGHPLTARVMVNRIWAHHFGAGIVPTLDNFGRSGDEPSNPMLLDWLATEFVRQGWSIKAMHRMMMTSAAYRQSSGVRPDGVSADPANKLLWRMNPRRVEAEVLRDSILAVAGALDLTMFGEPVKSEKKPSGEIVPEHDGQPGRRSIYLVVRRSAPQTLLNVLGAPVMEINCTRRATYNGASQALAMMNGEFVSAQAEQFARRVLGAEPSEAAANRLSIDQAFRLAFARRPSPRETDLLLTFVERQARHYDSMGAEDRRRRAFSDLCQTLLSGNEFLYVD
ncbi:MAG TPA: PSD1 and planctomycete cytochrome C domain-containing protein [Bryobacteraceae bacterium]|nr:PSD1 and planctomycete cytochrome C domain-containing protein [Bryobacteraceae bacterium]